jgi:hypothetical protein
MTTVPFLQRLAPAVTQAPSAVRAALPPRFAPQSVVEAEPIAAAAPAASMAAKPLPAQPVERHSAEAPAPTGPRTLPQHDAATVAVRAVQPTHATPVAAAPGTGRREAPSNATEPSAPPLARAGLASTEPALPPRPAAMAGEPARVQRSPEPAHSTPFQPPLSPATLAQRTLPQAAPTPPVIHVTIDRLDVRLPAPATAPKAAPKPRTTTTLPLADYLRQRRGEPPR